LPTDTYAVALFVSSTSGFAGPTADIGTTPALFNSSGGDYELTILNSGSSVFFGLVSTTPITRIFIGSQLTNQSPLSIQSFEIGENLPVSSTPEVSTLALIGSGLLGLGFLRRPSVRGLPPVRRT